MSNNISIPVSLGDNVFVVRYLYDNSNKVRIENHRVTEISWKETKTYQHKDLGWAVIANMTRYKFDNQNKSWFASYVAAKEFCSKKNLEVVNN